MTASLFTGVAMLAAKWTAYLITNSSVIFSDAVESIVHIVAVWFAWYALRVTSRPPDSEHHFGHEKIGFVSAGIEGGLICLAAVVIIITAIGRLVAGVTLQRLDVGITITAAAGTVNAALGFFLVRNGRRERSLVVEANGKHVLTDAWTSAGAVGGLLLASFTGLMWLDPIMAVVFAANILWEGSRLVMTSVNGLMDRADPIIEHQCRAFLDRFTKEHGISYHRFRLRMMGSIPHIDFHLQLSDSVSITEAHRIATLAEEGVRRAIGIEASEVFSHVEPTTVPRGHV
ncbi:MAG: cation transporter [Ignavibacteria bacterium]|nr:cation transporter [Ignavibacteria bacterium]